MAYIELQYLSSTITKFTTVKAYLPTDGMSGKILSPRIKPYIFFLVSVMMQQRL